jgi:hypothetical protein
MKVTKQETFYHEDHGATLKHKCEKKDSSIVPFYFHFWAFLFFYLAFLPFFYLGQCSINDDHHTSIYLQLKDYNSILGQSMTLYECLQRCTGIEMNQEWHVWKIMNGGFATNTMSTTWSCKAIWQWWTCHDKRNGRKLHGNISRNGYGNAIIGRYGGYFEEDIRRFMCDRAYRITGFGCTGEVCTNSQGEKGQCMVP